MKNLLLLVAATLISFSNGAKAVEAPSKKLEISLTQPKAGIDYPTDTAIPSWAEGKKVLVINEYLRIFVDDATTLSNPVAGIDYPTDAKKPSKLENVKILVLDSISRLPIIIERAKAGIDFPTDGPANLDRNFLVWVLDETTRIDVRNIAEIEKAKAGIDFPTEIPARDFFVMVVTDGSDGYERIPLN